MVLLYKYYYFDFVEHGFKLAQEEEESKLAREEEEQVKLAQEEEDPLFLWNNPFLSGICGLWPDFPKSQTPLCWISKSCSSTMREKDYLLLC
jgi:hypothetical protein